MKSKTDKTKIVLAATGASGVKLSLSFLKIILQSKSVEKVYFLYSNAAFEVYRQEEGCSLGKVLKKIENEKLSVYKEEFLSAEISSGSSFFSSMVILPSSMATIGAIASGASDGLIHRAADVCLKEERKLIICPRETPFSLIHLRNMTLLKEAGATILPFIPQYYTKPKTIKDLENHFFKR
ncbi:MAG: UbiX family flavin prenyltransferase, partial [Thermoanaerobaculaceae bacterium]|nr:UbiX family flavin prenyltransferase [Thermoanaerobaculaceae bacterium]